MAGASSMLEFVRKVAGRFGLVVAERMVRLCCHDKITRMSMCTLVYQLVKRGLSVYYRVHPSEPGQSLVRTG